MTDTGLRTPRVALKTSATLGEGPRWDDQTNMLWWVDLIDGVLHRTDPVLGLDEEWLLGGPLCGVSLTDGPELLVARADGLHLFDPLDGSTELVACLEGADPTRRPNDLQCDARGRLWISTLDAGFDDGAGVLYRVDQDQVTRMADGFTIPNGIDFSPDNTTLYLADSYQGAVYAFGFDLDSGTLSQRRTLVTIDASDGLPDGLCVDSAGTLWLALFGGGVVRGYTSDGEHVDTIELPVSQVTSCTFGGPDLAEVFITTARVGDGEPLSLTDLQRQPLAGSVFSLHLPTPGLPAPVFAARRTTTGETP